MTPLMHMPRATPRLYPTRTRSGLTYWHCMICDYTCTDAPDPRPVLWSVGKNDVRLYTPTLHTRPCPACAEHITLTPVDKGGEYA